MKLLLVSPRTPHTPRLRAMLDPRNLVDAIHCFGPLVRRLRSVNQFCTMTYRDGAVGCVEVVAASGVTQLTATTIR